MGPIIRMILTSSYRKPQYTAVTALRVLEEHMRQRGPLLPVTLSVAPNNIGSITGHLPRIKGKFIT